MKMKSMYPQLNDFCIAHQYEDNFLMSFGGEITGDVDNMVVEVLQLCDGKHTVDEIFNTLCNKFDVLDCSKEMVYDMITNFISSMVDDNQLKLTKNSVNNARQVVKSGQMGKVFPYLAVMELTDLCNFDCAHCYKDACNKKTNHVPVEKIKNVLDKLRGRTPILNLSGGEPTIHPQINQIIDCCNDFHTIVLSNGSKMENIDSNRFKNINCFQVSMYGGSAKTYEITTGKKINFDNFLNGLDIIKSRNKPAKIAIMLNKPIIKELDECLKILVDKQIKEVAIGTSIVEGRRVGESNDSIWNLTDNDINEADEAIERLKEKYINLIKFNNPNKLSAEVKWEKEPGNYELTCMGGRYVVTFSNRGIVKACNYLPDGSFDLGNYENYLENVEIGYVVPLEDKMRQFELELAKTGRTLKDYQCKGMCGKMTVKK